MGANFDGIEFWWVRPAFVVGALLTALTSASADAQSIGLRAIAAHIAHPQLGGMSGAGIIGTLPLGNKSSLQFGLEYLAGASEGVGVPCGGFVPPGTCPVQPVRLTGAATTGWAGLGVPLWEGNRIELSVFGALGGSSVRGTTRGLTTGTRIASSQGLFRLDGGVEGSWRPRARGAVSLNLGASVGWQSPVNGDVVLDGYDPFARGAQVVRLWAGAAWRPDRGR